MNLILSFKTRSKYLLICFLLMSMNSFGQDSSNAFPFTKVDHTATAWWQEMNSDLPNVLLAEGLFNDYFEEHAKESSKQKKLFTRWLQDARLSVDAQGVHISPPRNRTAATSVQRNTTVGTWRMLGPNFAEKTKCNGTSANLSGGFCDRVYINPYNTSNLFAGFSYGGLWVSQDQGATWNLTDADFDNGTNTYANRDYYYGEIEASMMDHALVFAATEAGLLKSTDGGQTWMMSPQLNRSASNSERPYYVALSTANENVVISTFGRNVYRSLDQGNTWSVVFDNTGGGSNRHFTSQYNNNSLYGLYNRNFNFFGLEQDLNDPMAFYLGIWNANNEPCIYKSTDGGASFSFLVNLALDLDRTMPANILFQTIMEEPDQLYIYGQFTSDTLYRYNENGILDSKTKIGATVEAGAINWNDDSIMYTGFYGASSIMKSVDGAASFIDQTNGYAGCPKYVHPDVRDISAVGDLILIGSDGGLALSTDAMNTVHTVGREISSIDLWGFSSSPKSNILSAGCDHGPTKIRRYDGDNGWISRGGGDAGQTSVNQSNDRWIYYNHGYGVFKTELGDNGEFLSTEGISGTFSLHRVEFHPNLYFTAFGTQGSEVKVSRDNFSTFQTFYDFGATVNRFKIAPQNSSTLYVLHGQNTVKRSVDAGQTWLEITPPINITPQSTNIIDLTVGDDPGEIWLAYGNWQNETKVLKSSDGGETWSNITTPNLPTNPVREIVYQSGTDGGVYIGFAGKDGVWYRNNSMPQWESLGTGLPMIGYLQHLYTVPPKGKFRMGSSRGSWEHDLYEESMTPVANFAASTNQVICPSSPVHFVQNAMHSSGAATYQWTFDGGYPSSSVDAAPSVYYAAPGSYDVTLVVTDEFGMQSTKVLTDFITVANNCPDADGDGIDDFEETASCFNPIPTSAPIALMDSIMVTDFSLATSGTFYCSVEIGNLCDASYAVMTAFVNLDDQVIDILSFRDFNSSSVIDPIAGSGTSMVSSLGTVVQIALNLNENQLYLVHLGNDCPDDFIQLNEACWGDVDADGDGQVNAVDLDSDNDGIPDYTENTPCYDLIPSAALPIDSDTIEVYHFSEQPSDDFFMELNVGDGCDDQVATIKLRVSLNDESIRLLDYTHFDNTNNEMTSSGSNVIISASTQFAQIGCEFADSKLKLFQVSNACTNGITLLGSCFSPLDMDNDQILNYLDLDSDNDGLTDAEESDYCGTSVGTSSWFSAGESTLVVDLSTIPSAVNEYFVNIVAFTNCYNTSAILEAVVDVDRQRINVSSYDHFASASNNFTGNGTNSVRSESTSFANVRFSLDGDLITLHQESNACGSVLRLNPSCISAMDTTCLQGYPNYLSTNSFAEELSLCAGESYQFGSQTLTDSGVYTELFTSANGCDSTVVLAVELDEPIDTTLSISNATLTANESGASYQWLDCENDFATIEGAISQSFTATTDGIYAVNIQQGDCSEISSCYAVNLVGTSFEYEREQGFSVYPNPTSGNATIVWKDRIANVDLNIIDYLGQEVYKEQYENTNAIPINVDHFPNGVYIINLFVGEHTIRIKLVKQ